MTAMTAQFRNTSCRLILDVTRGLNRQLTDANWIGAFCLPMIGSLGHECAGFTKMEEEKPTVMGSLGGISFPQWTGVRVTTPMGRREQFMRHCRQMHLHPYSYDAAVSFIIYELKNTARGVVSATMTASPASPELVEQLEMRGAVDRALLGRVIKFEKLYENAGVKHYPSRYRYALLARDAYSAWAHAGFPPPGKFVMPRSRFSAQYDKEFGRGESETTARWDSHAALAVGVMSAEMMAPGGADAAPAPAPARAKRYPEQLLTREEIVVVQKRLRALGYVGVGEANGVWGTSTIGAISALQAEAQIDVDGHYGPDTRKALADGVKHTVSEARATVTSAELLKAGEPTIQAVQPASITAKVGTVVATGSAAVSGITSAWPDASSTIDTIKGYFADVPGWVWFAAVAAVAAYLWLSTRQVKKSVVAGYREGAVKTLEEPVKTTRLDATAAVPAVPDYAPSLDTDEPELHARDSDSVASHDDRPLGAE